MFDLEQAIAGWRRQMLTGGIQSPEYLDELESHLRDDLEGKIKSGLDEPESFSAALRQMGRAEVLQTEFAKSRDTLRRSWQRLIHHFTGIPHPQLVTNMNTSPAILNPESRWAAYVKAAAFALPAAFIWFFSVAFIMPQLQQLCAHANMALFTFKDAPGIFQAFAFVGQGLFILTHYAFAAGLVILLAFGLLEWRAGGWPRYRRAVLGAGAFLLNLAVLISITLMVVTAIVAVSNLPHLK